MSSWELRRVQTLLLHSHRLLCALIKLDHVWTVTRVVNSTNPSSYILKRTVCYTPYSYDLLMNPSSCLTANSRALSSTLKLLIKIEQVRIFVLNFHLFFDLVHESWTASGRSSCEIFKLVWPANLVFSQVLREKAVSYCNSTWCTWSKENEHILTGQVYNWNIVAASDWALSGKCMESKDKIKKQKQQRMPALLALPFSPLPPLLLFCYHLPSLIILSLLRIITSRLTFLRRLENVFE